jgi:hypothetical protein
MAALGTAPACTEQTARGTHEGSPAVSRDAVLVKTAQAKLVADDVASNEEFGSSVAISGNRAVVGAWFEDRVGLTDAGAAYVFVRSGDTWTQEGKLVASDAVAGDRFGAAVAIDGDTIVVGATDVDGPDQSGCAYVFVRGSSSWSEQAKLRADAPSPSGQFGVSVAVQGDRAVVGAYTASPVPANGTAPGYAYLYTRSGTIWSFETRLDAGSTATTNFGAAVALDGSAIAVGAPLESPGGRVHVFRLSGTWSHEGAVAPVAAVAGDRFGAGVALSGDRLVAGAPAAAVGGRAFVFERNAGVWGGETELATAHSAGEYGQAVALDGDTAAVGAWTNPGGTFVFHRESGSWVVGPALSAATNTRFGYAVALDAGVLVSGASTDGDLAPSGGAAHVFVLEDKLASGDACSTAGECASGICEDHVCCKTACGDSDANDCQACSVAAGADSDGECAILGSSTVCRASAGSCDAAETCGGSDAACPADASEPDGTSCPSGTCASGACDTSGSGGSSGIGGAAGEGGLGDGGTSIAAGGKSSFGGRAAGGMSAGGTSGGGTAAGEGGQSEGGDTSTGGSGPGTGGASASGGATSGGGGEVAAAGFATGGRSSASGGTTSAAAGKGGTASGGRGSGGNPGGGRSGGKANAGGRAGASGSGSAAKPGDGSTDSGGCGCHVATSNRPLPAALLLATALLFGSRRRRAGTARRAAS